MLILNYSGNFLILMLFIHTCCDSVENKITLCLWVSFGDYKVDH